MTTTLRVMVVAAALLSSPTREAVASCSFPDRTQVFPSGSSVGLACKIHLYVHGYYQPVPNASGVTLEVGGVPIAATLALAKQVSNIWTVAGYPGGDAGNSCVTQTKTVAYDHYILTPKALLPANSTVVVKGLPGTDERSFQTGSATDASGCDEPDAESLDRPNCGYCPPASDPGDSGGGCGFSPVAASPRGPGAGSPIALAALLVAGIILHRGRPERSARGPGDDS